MFFAWRPRRLYRAVMPLSLINLPQLPALVNDNAAKSKEMTLKMDITYLLQIIAVMLINLIVLPPVARLADWYARRIRYDPIERTWLSVVLGFTFSEVAILILVEVTLFIFGYGGAWWIPPLYVIIVYGITGGCQVYQQEDKRRDNVKKANELNDLDDIVKWQDNQK